MENKPRKPWVAGLLTYITIGLGHLYCGKVKKGAILFLGNLLSSLALILSYLVYAPFGLVHEVAYLAYMIYCIIDSVKIAKSSGSSYSLRKYNRWYIYLLCFMISISINVIVAVTVKNQIVQIYRIPSRAMAPTLLAGDHIIVDKFTHKRSGFNRGDIVVFPYPKEPSKDFVKRIVGIGGDTLEIKNKQVFINDKPYQENYKIHSDPNIYRDNANPRDNFGPVKIPEDSLFVLGDNRDQSHDSRFWGFVKKPSVKGKVIKVYWSRNKDTNKIRWNRMGIDIK